ncbi:uncharacterized protein ARMOST_16844 [Armillaria ostoyae]|uniref:Ribonuclease H1 N-terminal domain-containing protein n=1 Tax=Armillaria ostoyae TaxID=47428 RepID=A0A284RXB2_ARMOS|nr:uncharacterized protein ARMOST_16844 [Armillaria ostoyae]
MHKPDKEEERLWESLDDYPVLTGMTDCVPCIPVFYPDAGDENLIKTGGKRLYVVRQGLVPGVYSNWRMAQKQVLGFSESLQESFMTWEECLSYWQEGCKPGAYGHATRMPAPVIVSRNQSSGSSSSPAASSFTMPQRHAVKTPLSHGVGTTPGTSTPLASSARRGYSAAVSISSPPGMPTTARQPSSSGSRASKGSKKPLSQFHIVINTSRGKKSGFSDLAQAQASMIVIQGHGEKCRLNISSNLEDALDSSDGSD